MNRIFFTIVSILMTLIPVMAQQKINNKMNMPRPSWMWIYGVIIIFIVGYWMFGPGNGVPVKSDWNTVAQMIEQGDVEKIQVVNRDLAEIYLKKDAADRYRKDAVDPRFRNMPETGAQLTFNIGSVDTFRQDLDKVTAESGKFAYFGYVVRKNNLFQRDCRDYPCIPVHLRINMKQSAVRNLSALNLGVFKVDDF